MTPGFFTGLEPVPEAIPDPWLKCLRCGHRWHVRKYDDDAFPILPKRCPKCKSPYWNRKRLTKRARREAQKAAGKKGAESRWRGSS